MLTEMMGESPEQSIHITDIIVNSVQKDLPQKQFRLELDDTEEKPFVLEDDLCEMREASPRG